MLLHLHLCNTRFASHPSLIITYAPSIFKNGHYPFQSHKQRLCDLTSYLLWKSTNCLIHSCSCFVKVTVSFIPSSDVRWPLPDGKGGFERRHHSGSRKGSVRRPGLGSEEFPSLSGHQAQGSTHHCPTVIYFPECNSCWPGSDYCDKQLLPAAGWRFTSAACDGEDGREADTTQTVKVTRGGIEPWVMIYSGVWGNSLQNVCFILESFIYWRPGLSVGGSRAGNGPRARSLRLYSKAVKIKN